jgi:alkanesulfonate monooxygenase SsuD/methylene tetrahydromethanopterin reductase-like flavin-dependent oxidoreductase (luciferase family)
VAELYGQVMRQCELAETLGYDTFFCAEHHLTFHDPRRIAETYAMVDMMGGGRLVFGVGSGYLVHEFVGYGSDPKEKRGRFNENLDIVRRLLAGETLAYKGQFSSTEKVVLNVRPHEGRVPPIHVAVLAREAAYHVGRQGNRIFTVPYASCRDFAGVGNMLAEFRKGRAEAGLPADDDDHIVTLHTHVAASDGEAKRQEMGVRHVATMHNFGALEPRIVERSMTLFAREVMPALRN